MKTDLEDQLGKRLAALLDESVTPDIATRLAYARTRAVQRAAELKAPSVEVGPGLLAARRPDWKLWSFAAVISVLIAAKLVSGFVNTDDDWQTEVQYHVQADSPLDD